MHDHVSPKAQRAAARIGAILDGLAAYEGRDDYERSVSDLLADVMHFCDREGIDVTAAATRAREDYLDERDPHYDDGTAPVTPDCPPLDGLRFHPMVGGCFLDPEDGTTAVDEAIAIAVREKRERGEDDGEPVAVLVCLDDLTDAR